MLGAFIGGLLAYLTTARKIYDASVVQERKKWRRDVTRLTLELGDCFRNKKDILYKDRLFQELELRLNPSDTRDKEILEALSEDELTGRVAILLKHDWERVKLESSLFKRSFIYADRPLYDACAAPKKKDFRKFRIRLWAVFASASFIIFWPFLGPEYISSTFFTWLNYWVAVISRLFALLC
ncbi:hypothetical protein [Tranquillimonas rosea]|uniref:hypothetical protein n=1 Tax=Tranquillimonas rosea TaxID=641238 RepID=UPI003BA85BA2